MANTSNPSVNQLLQPTNDSDPSERGCSPVQSWVRFEEEEKKNDDCVATIVPTQTIQVDSVVHNTSHPMSEVLSSSDTDTVVDPKSLTDRASSPPGFAAGRNSPNKTAIPPPPAVLRPTMVQTTDAPASRSSCPPDFTQDNGHSMRNISLAGNSVLQRHPNSHGITQGFGNGDVIVTLLPVNQKLPWITKALFKPELVPEELMAQELTLTVEDYVMTMQVLVNDVRFNLYNVCYKRVLILWIMLGFFILLSLLFSGVRGLALFGGGIVWLIVNAMGIFFCMWLKMKLYRMLEQCMASVNALLHKHKILIGLDDRGKISCHKVNLIFVYFDVSYCIKYLKDMLDNEEKAPANEVITDPKRGQPTIQSRMDIDTSDIIITGSNSTRLSQKEKYAEKLFTRYSQRWVKEFVRKRLDLRLPLHSDGTLETGPPAPPRHCATSRCPCQFIEEHLRFKPTSKCNIRELFS